MHPLEYNLELAGLMLAEMKDYLLSKEVFWPLAKRAHARMPPFPNLTIGNLLLTLDELQAQRDGMSPEQAARVARLELQMQTTQSKWTVAIERRAVREMHTRLNLWREYLVDIESRSDTGENYHYEVRQRVIFARLEAIAKEAAEVQSVVDEMRQLDKRLRAVFIRDQFIWDPQLQPVYPRQQFWYLYGSIRPTN